MQVTEAAMQRAAVAEMNLQELQSRALRASGLLKAMSNPVRLIILCQLAEGEKSVGELERVVDVSQSALSQHLALLRQRGIVRFRREGQTIYYALAGPEAPTLLAALYAVYCSNIRGARAPRARRRPA
ncbi:MAG: metalloregulator ArsR/SmtB family transcription factor [Burkholderiales bacterium]|nr:metalloregulator ArsR/SmtB family transcription factor [Burkholderiales bacterium]